MGCMLPASGLTRQNLDIDYHTQAAHKAFHANRGLLCDRHLSISAKLRAFDTLITPVACFAAGHRTPYAEDLRQLDVAFRKLLRQVVGPPANTDWAQPWHIILHSWHERVCDLAAESGVHAWSVTCLRCHWRLAAYAMSLPAQRLLRRTLAWQPAGRRPQGRPVNTWDNKLVQFCRYRGLGEWCTLAQDRDVWLSLADAFVDFCAP